MSTYDVRAEWDDTGWWVVTVPDVLGAITQCRRLDQVPTDIAEAIGLITGTEPATDAIRLHWEVPGEAGELADRARRLREEADRLAAEAGETAQHAVQKLRARKFSYRDIGVMTKMSYQRAQQIASGRRGSAPRARPRGARGDRLC